MSKTTSRELSKQLEEAGADFTGHYFYWALDDGKWKLWDQTQRSDYETPKTKELIPTLDATELLERIPSQIGGQVSTEFDGNYYQLTIVAISDGRYEVGYKPYLGGAWWTCRCGQITETLGRLKLWCLQNGHCNA